MAIGTFRSDEAQGAYVSAYTQAMSEMDSPTRTLDIATEYGSVRAYVWANDAAPEPPVLLLPGRSSGVPMWQENLPDLLPHRSVIAIDALGDAGLSVQTQPLKSLTDQAAWVDQTLSALGVERAHVVGHSFGGATAAAYAVHFPGRTASLALLEPVFTLAWPPVSTFLWTTVASLPVPQLWRDQALARIGGVELSDIRKRTPLSDMIAAASKGYRASLPMPRLLTDEQFTVLTMPIYLAIAESSSLAGGARAARRGRLIPHAQVEVWPDTTHSLPMQVHEALAERLLTFWAAADGASR